MIRGSRHYQDELGSGFGKQYLTAKNACEAIQITKAIYGKLNISEGANLVPYSISSFATSKLKPTLIRMLFDMSPPFALPISTTTHGEDCRLSLHSAHCAS